MNQMDQIIEVESIVAGKPVSSSKKLEVRHPYDNQLVGTVTNAGIEDVEKAISMALEGGKKLSRYERYEIIVKARDILKSRQDEFARLITAESGLAIHEAYYETNRSLDVLLFASMEALNDDGEIFSCDISPNGKKRKIFTLREPLSLAVAITPFNHPLNQVVHKIIPAIVAGTPVILKPSEKTPLTAVKFVEVLYEAGLPDYMMSVVLGPTDEVATPLVQDDRVELVSFTGSVSVGKHITRTAGYKKVILELGGNAPLIILKDADLEIALELAAEGAFRNSGQRCTAVKRILIHEDLHDEFIDRYVERTREYTCGDPFDEETKVGTVIDEEAAKYLEEVVHMAKDDGAKILLGGNRKGALMEPTILTNVSPESKIVKEESFGPLAPVMTFSTIDEAIQIANSTSYGLSSGVVTNNMDLAIRFIKELKTGTVNINAVPGYRIEKSPFGGVKDSGLGIKEGVIEAIKSFTYVKTFSLPW